MYDNDITRITRPKKVEWKSPTRIFLDLEDDNGSMSFELLKGASDYLHKQIDIKQVTSKELYKKAESLWQQLRDMQLSKCLDRPRDEEQFSLTKPTVIYLTTENNCVVDIEDLRTEEHLKEFEDLHQKLTIELTTRNNTGKFYQDGKDGLIKFVCYDKNVDLVSNEYTPVILIEMNHQKSTYKVYSGILIYSIFTFIPSVSCDLEVDRLYNFISRFDMMEFLQHSTERAEELYNAYKGFVERPIEISARELTALFKKVGYKLELDEVDRLHPIENLADKENNKKVQDFYNTFQFTTGETAFDILQLSDFRKTFRYNKMTLLDVLGILSKEYLTYSGSKITAEVLGDIMYKLYDINTVDKAQVQIIENEKKGD